MTTNDSGMDIHEQAARLAVRMAEPADTRSAAEREELRNWLLTDERHADAFRAANGVLALIQDLPPADRERLSALATAGVEGRASSRRQVWRWSALAASVLIAVFMGGYVAKTQGWLADSYVTHTGESRVVTFAEGSVAYLNTRTEVRWVGSNTDRRVALLGGEALFDVVHDETRPFRVMLDNSEIRVLGTRFNVYRKPGGETIVTVLEGTVEVRGYGSGSVSSEWKRTLRADEQIEYQPIGLIHEPHQVVALNAVRWRTGVLKLEGAPIPDVIDELTRYTDQRILIRDPRIAEIHFSGALSTRDVRKALGRMQELAPVEVKESNGIFTLDFRPSASAGKKD